VGVTLLLSLYIFIDKIVVVIGGLVAGFRRRSLTCQQAVESGESPDSRESGGAVPMIHRLGMIPESSG
jgi:hypothetical protein